MTVVLLPQQLGSLGPSLAAAAQKYRCAMVSVHIAWTVIKKFVTVDPRNNHVMH